MATSYPIFNSDPNAQAQAALLDQRQQMAQMLLQQGFQPMGGTESVGGMAIRKSPLEGLAKLLQIYSGGKGLQDIAMKRAELASEAYGNQLKLNQEQTPPSYGQDQLLGASTKAFFDGGQGGDYENRMARALMAQEPNPGTPFNPRNPSNIPARLLTDFQAGMIPKEVFDAQVAGFKPTEATIAARQGGFDPVLANQQAFAKTVTDPKILAMQQAGFSPEMINRAMMGETAKAAEIERKGGNQFVNPFLGSSGIVPKIPDYANPVGGIAPNGAIPGGVSPMPGAQGVAMGNSQATSTGSANGSILNVTTPDGSVIPMRGGQAVGGGGIPAPQSAAPTGGAPVMRQPPVARPTLGQSTTNAAMQKSAADVIGQAPQIVQQSKSAITGLESALNVLETGIKTGPGTGKSVSALALLNNMGVPLMKDDVNGYQTLQKYLQNSLNQAAQGTGASGSDARFESFMHGQPNADTMNADALRGAIRYVLSQHDAAAARGQFLTQAYQRAAASNDPNAALTAQQQWSQIYKPDYFAFNRMDGKEQAEALKRMGNKAQEFVKGYNSYAAQTGWVK